jgi:HEAT repeat protein
VDPLLEALNDPDWEVRQAAVYALGAFEDERVIPALLPRLRDDSGDVRSATAYMLGEMGDSRVLPALKWVMENDGGTTWEGDPVRVDTQMAIEAIESRSNRKL